MEKNRVHDLVKGFSGKKVLVVGDAVIDHYIHGVVERLNPEAPVPILEVREEHDASGGAGNTAKNLAMLGADAVLISVVGNDAAADRLEGIVTREGYTSVFIRDTDRPTIQKIRHIVGSQQLLRVDFEKTHDIAETVEDELIAAIDEECKNGVEAILVSDYAKGVITKRVAEAIMKHKGNGMLIVADIKPSHASLFIGADIISPNRKEAHEILGLNQHEQGGQKPADLAHALQDKMKTNVFVTLSADGVYVLSLDGEEFHVPQAHVVEVFDPSGAGDTSAAAMTLAKLAGATWQELAELCNAAGAVVVQKVGSVGITQQELIDMLTHTHE